MFSLFKKNKPVLVVKLGSRQLGAFNRDELPLEKTFSAEIPSDLPNLSLIDSRGKVRNFDLSSALAEKESWIHLCIRISPECACQVDCLLSRDKEAPAASAANSGIRFQPFFLPEFENAPRLEGMGLIARGLHYPGYVTPGWVSLMVICDHCEKSFRLGSFHTGFSNMDYAYCSEGPHTLIFDPNLKQESLPPCKACHGVFGLENSLRCPHCAAAFTKFGAGFADRKQEYYGAYAYGTRPQTL